MVRSLREGHVVHLGVHRAIDFGPILGVFITTEPRDFSKSLALATSYKLRVDCGPNVRGDVILVMTGEQFRTRC